MLSINTKLDVGFEISISKNILDPDNDSLLSLGYSQRRLVFVDSNVFNVYGNDIYGYFNANYIEAKIISIDISEEKKDLETLMFMLNSIENFGLLRRSEPIIAIGGGVLLDMIGFAANIYRRGVPYIKVPTTLLSIVDASVGVKTSINHFGMRNRLGTYYAPLAVFLDKSFLKSLPSSEIFSAMGEIVKMAVIKDKGLFELLEDDIEKIIKQKFMIGEVSDEIIFKSIKGMVQELEPNLWEHNLRRIVDFGHSFSPLPEMNSLEDKNVDSITHGQAVGLDVIFSSCLSYSRKLLSRDDLKRIINVCKNCSLPVTHPYFENHLLLWNALLDTTKHRNGEQNLPIPTDIGQSTFLNDVTLEDVKNTVKIFKEITS